MTPTWDLLKLWWTPRRAARFWARVNKESGPYGCWIWTGSLSDTGHGQIWMCGGLARVHRITWMLERERDIPDCMVIRHLLCNNKPCCNPAHLVGGTQGENCFDTVFIHGLYNAQNVQCTTHISG